MPSADRVEVAELRAQIDGPEKTAQGMPVASSLAHGYCARITELRHGLSRRCCMTVDRACRDRWRLAAA
jgi:hypothetical protein